MRTVTLLLGTLALAACASSSPPAPAASSSPVRPAVAADSDQAARDVCRASFVRQRDCTDEWIPALVDLRVRLDKPAGIAAEDARSGRPALVQQAMQEWSTDSTDGAIASTCDHILVSMPPDQLGAVLQQARDCLATTDCNAFVQCQLPLLEGQMNR